MKFSDVKTLWPIPAAVLLLAIGLFVAKNAQREPQFESDAWPSITLPVDLPNILDLRLDRAKQNGVDKKYLPDPRLTPGAYWIVPLEKIKQPGYSATVRHVTEKMKLQVMDAYGWPHDKPCEIDHLIPLSIGGLQDASNPTSNLWPEPADGEWSFHRKDKLEVHLLKLVRDGEADLRTVQREISEDWIACYRKYLGESTELSAQEIEAEANE